MPDSIAARMRFMRSIVQATLWMLTSRDVYRMLVHESGWSADRYQAWLSDTLVRLLTDCVGR